MLTQPVALAIAWPGAGHSSASLWRIHSISAVVTLVVLAWLFWLTERMRREDARRSAHRPRRARILLFPGGPAGRGGHLLRGPT
jgi:hypothetical protein